MKQKNVPNFFTSSLSYKPGKNSYIIPAMHALFLLRRNTTHLQSRPSFRSIINNFIYLNAFVVKMCKTG